MGCKYLAPHDVAYFAGQCGEASCEAYEAAGEVRAAVQAYKFDAMFVSQPAAGRYICCGVFEHIWNDAGLALKRAGLFDMAERAYSWALVATRSDERFRELVLRNLMAVHEARSKTDEQLLENRSSRNIRTDEKSEQATVHDSRVRLLPCRPQKGRHQEMCGLRSCPVLLKGLPEG